MKVFLAATSDKSFIGTELKNCKYLLESYYYFQEWQKPLIHSCEMFLLDSGAFTFMNNAKNVDFNEYLEKYINFINQNKIDYFFELDIDSVVGYEKVKELRLILEKRTGKQCIPVWHKNRGIEEWYKMCEEYNYVAIGGIVTKEITKKEYPIFTPLLKYAHEKGCRVHGLGFTSMQGMKQYRFDSVDSTNWKSGGRFGQLHIFNGHTVISKSFQGKRAKNYSQIDKHNYGEWIKFQKYAEVNL